MSVFLLVFSVLFKKEKMYFLGILFWNVHCAHLVQEKGLIGYVIFVLDISGGGRFYIETLLNCVL